MKYFRVCLLLFILIPVSAFAIPEWDFPFETCSISEYFSYLNQTAVQVYTSGEAALAGDVSGLNSLDRNVGLYLVLIDIGVIRNFLSESSGRSLSGLMLSYQVSVYLETSETEWTEKAHPF